MSVLEAVPLDRISQVRAEFERMGCAQLRDAARERTCVIEPSLLCRTPGLKVAGPVFPVATENDMLPGLQALDGAPPGYVLFIHNTARESDALAGDILVTAAREQGLGGLIVDGAVRDIDFFPELGFPVFSREVRYVSAKTAQVPAASVPEAVELDGVVVEPGDWIFGDGDGDGVLLMKGRHLSAVINGALLLLAEEEALKEQLRSGRRFAELCGLHDFLAGKGPLRFDP